VPTNNKLIDKIRLLVACGSIQNRDLCEEQSDVLRRYCTGVFCPSVFRDTVRLSLNPMSYFQRNAIPVSASL
jgi:hypothetical protein